MANVTISIDPNAGAIYAGPPSALGAELPGVTIAGDYYILSPSGQYLQSDTGPTYRLGLQGYTIVNYSESGDYMIATGVQSRQLNAPGADTPQRVIGGSALMSLPDGRSTVVPVDYAVSQPAGLRLLVYRDAADNEHTNWKIPSDMSLNDALRQSGAVSGHFATPTEARNSGLYAYLRHNEQALLEEVRNSGKPAEEGYNDTISGAAEWLIDNGSLAGLQAFTQYFVHT